MWSPRRLQLRTVSVSLTFRISKRESRFRRYSLRTFRCPRSAPARGRYTLRIAADPSWNGNCIPVSCELSGSRSCVAIAHPNVGMTENVELFTSLIFPQCASPRSSSVLVVLPKTTDQIIIVPLSSRLEILKDYNIIKFYFRYINIQLTKREVT